MFKTRGSFIKKSSFLTLCNVYKNGLRYLLLKDKSIILQAIDKDKKAEFLIVKCRTEGRAKEQFKKFNRWFNEIY